MYKGIKCNCGNILNILGQEKIANETEDTYWIVEPCKNCLEEANNIGYDQCWDDYYETFLNWENEMKNKNDTN